MLNNLVRGDSHVEEQESVVENFVNIARVMAQNFEKPVPSRDCSRSQFEVGVVFGQFSSEFVRSLVTYVFVNLSNDQSP